VRLVMLNDELGIWDCGLGILRLLRSRMITDNGKRKTMNWEAGL